MDDINLSQEFLNPPGHNTIVQSGAADASRIRKGRRNFPFSSVGDTFTPGATGRQIEEGKTKTSAPAAATLSIWYQAVVQIRSAPSLRGKLYNTRTRSCLWFILLLSRSCLVRTRQAARRPRPRWARLRIPPCLKGQPLEFSTAWLRKSQQKCKPARRISTLIGGSYS